MVRLAHHERKLLLQRYDKVHTVPGFKVCGSGPAQYASLALWGFTCKSVLPIA